MSMDSRTRAIVAESELGSIDANDIDWAVDMGMMASETDEDRGRWHIELYGFIVAAQILRCVAQIEDKP